MFQVSTKPAPNRALLPTLLRGGRVTSQKNVYVGVFKIRVQLRASCYWDVSARHQRDGARRQIKIDGR